MSFFNTLIPSLNGECAVAEAPSTRRPRYAIAETPEGYEVEVNLPGVAKEGLEITDEAGELRISGKPARELPEGRVLLQRETSDAAFVLLQCLGDPLRNLQGLAELDVFRFGKRTPIHAADEKDGPCADPLLPSHLQAVLGDLRKPALHRVANVGKA